MGANSGIEWTDHTFNCWWGCVKVSAACDHCYAETMAKRSGFQLWGKGADRRMMTDAYWHQPLSWNRWCEKHGERRSVFFCAGAEDEPICRSLVEMGYMKQHATTQAYPYYNCSVTDAGKEAVRRESPKPPKLTRAQKRYREFLKADTGRPFGEWLKDQQEAQR